MYYIYILQSKNNGSYYIGSTDNVGARLSQHNAGRSRSTKASLPWELFYVEKFVDRRSAIKRERQLKSWKSRYAIERLKFL